LKSKVSVKRKEVAKKADRVEVAPDTEPASESISLPGSFPSENLDDNIVAIVTETASAKKKGKKGKQQMATAEPNRSLEPKSKAEFVAAPPPPVPVEPPPPPTQPSVEPEPPKPARQRARIIRDNNDMSWGFWGSPKKKETKPKEADPVVAPSEPSPPKTKNGAPGLTRTKSAKKPMENGAEKSSSQSSSSDKASQPETRPSTSEKPRRPSQPRKMSILDILAGPPPSKSKTQRRTSAPNAVLRRQSLPVETSLPTSPPENVSAVPEMSAKAAKILGAGPQREAVLSRKESKRRKDKPPGTSANSFAWLAGGK
jgi:hypothetical protein